MFDGVHDAGVAEIGEVQRSDVFSIRVALDPCNDLRFDLRENRLALDTACHDDHRLVPAIYLVEE